MTRLPILFRCDASSQRGWESFYQCLLYAAALQRRRRGTYVQATVEPAGLAHLIHRGGSEWMAADHEFGSIEDAHQLIQTVRRLDAGAIILAGAGLSEEYLERLRAAGITLVLLDSEAKVDAPVDLIINPLLCPTHYRHPPGTQLLVGRRYALVRSLFRRQRPLRAQEPSSPPFRALVALGDDDLKDQSLLRAEQLLDTTKVDRVSIIVRPHHPRLEELRAIAREQEPRIEILTELNEISTRVARAHFALTSGDGWSLEVACVGIPQLLITQQERHVANAVRMDEEGAATYLGPAETVSAEQLHEAADLLMSDPLERLGMSRCARMLVDGRGQDRIVNGLEVMLHLGTQRQVRSLAA